MIIRYAYYMSKLSTNPDAALIARAVLKLGRRLRAERPTPSLTLSAMGLLATLHRDGRMPAARLAQAERLQPQSLSRLIARLDDAGLIARSPGEGDRRTLVIAVTPAGRRVLKRDMDARRAWLEQAMAASLTLAEREQLEQAAGLMLRLAETAAPGHDGDRG